ncbi:rhodanese-like domain-containing protein [Deinococcus sp.]|uniref:rhodanese-like domain-containing protein n=1 Tax=Deinococcus sp. TaxID=47478 RepID=UPI003B5AA3A1
MNEVTPQDAQSKVKNGALLIDVREANEYAEVHAQDAQLMPLSEFAQQYSELPKDKELIVICRSGARSAQAAQHLLDNGYSNVSNLKGGTMAWQEAGLPTEGESA